MEICEACKDEIDELRECKCTEGKPTLAIAVRWIEETEVFDKHERRQIALLIKRIETPQRSFDKKWEIHHQLAAALAVLKAKYLFRGKEAKKDKEVYLSSQTLVKRNEYSADKGSKPWKMYEHEIKKSPQYMLLIETCDRAEAAHDFLDNFMRIMHNRGDAINKMSDDRRQLRRSDLREEF